MRTLESSPHWEIRLDAPGIDFPLLGKRAEIKTAFLFAMRHFRANPYSTLLLVRVIPASEISGKVEQRETFKLALGREAQNG